MLNITIFCYFSLISMEYLLIILILISNSSNKSICTRRNLTYHVNSKRNLEQNPVESFLSHRGQGSTYQFYFFLICHDDIRITIGAARANWTERMNKTFLAVYSLIKYVTMIRMHHIKQDNVTIKKKVSFISWGLWPIKMNINFYVH